MSSAHKRFAFQDAGLNRAEEFRENESVLDAFWPQARIIIIDLQGNARFKNEHQLPEFLSGADLFSERPKQASFLGQANDENWFAIAAEYIDDLPVHALDLRSAAATWPAMEAAVFAQARALLYWQQRNLFCGVCAHKLALMRAGFMAKCEACGSERYPRTDAAVIMAVSDGKHLLLGRQASWPKNRWSVLAGFLEPGESLEHTVMREVFEEAGVRIESAHYAASQTWPFPASLMLGFHAYAKPQKVNVGDELEQAQWFSAQEIHDGVSNGDMGISPRLSISRWLIDDWCEQQGVPIAHLAQAAFIK